MKKKGFTLAEVLITLAVIGIVAALTIGVFLPKIHSTIRARQIATAEVKFTKAMEQMALNNAIGPYYKTTQEFVDELQNYLKISKVCSNDKLEECFGYEKIKADDEEFEIKNLKSGKDDFGMTAEGTDYAETVGIVTIDGTSMLLSWDKNCKILEPKVYQWGNNTNETTSCVAIVMDVNTDKSPNTLNKDVALFRANRVGQACGLQFSYEGKNYCWSKPFSANTNLTHEECIANKEKLGIQNCFVVESWFPSTDDDDYWGGTVKACGGTSKIPSMEDLTAFANYLFNKNESNKLGTYQTSFTGMSLNTSRLSETAPLLPSNGFFLWSNEEDDSQLALSRSYGKTYVGGGITYRHDSGLYAVCKIKN